MMAYEKIVAVYDKAAKAKEAARALEASGFPAGDISLLNRDSLTDAEIHEAGLWRRLFGRNVGDHESTVYGRTIESGGAVLTLRTADTEVSRAMKIRQPAAARGQDHGQGGGSASGRRTTRRGQAPGGNRKSAHPPFRHRASR